MKDAFVGKWQLDPTQSDYQAGLAPQSGTYTIDRQEDGYHVTMEWVGEDGSANQATYVAIPDGADHPYIANPVVDTISMTRVDERTLNSDTKKDGEVVTWAKRVLSEDGQSMHITQSGKLPDGSTFDNVSVYKRVT